MDVVLHPDVGASLVMCWINDTGQQPVQIAGIDKDTILDGFVYPFKAVKSISPDGDLCQEIRGGKLGNVMMTIKKAMRGSSNKK